MSKEVIACDFFAGAGGLSDGLRMVGINVAFANEINEHASATYKQNHSSTSLITKDIRDLSTKEIIDITDNKIFLVAGGPPCQGFSMAGKRNIDDPRNLLFKEFAKMVSKLEPKYFLMENVVGMMSMANGKFIIEAEKLFEDIGYSVSKRIFNATNFGVPQSRRRLFILGCRKKAINLNDMEIENLEKVTVKDAMGDLDFLKPGQNSSKYLRRPATKYQKVIRDGMKILFNHDAPNHSSTTIKRFSMMKQGETINDIPARFRNAKRVMYRIKASEPSRTITTLPDDLVHYKQNRILTVREFARLQSFRDSYIFLGPKSTGGLKRRTGCPQYTQVGNAVPPLMAKFVSSWIQEKAKA